MRTLATDEIGKSYRRRRVVNGVSLRVEQGEVVGLLGPNGAGKTTTFYAIVGLIPPDTGRVLYDGQDITDVPMYLRARQFGISYLSQVNRRREHPRGAGSATNFLARAPRKDGEVDRRTGTGAHPPESRICPFRRRAAARGNCPLPVHQPDVYFARRAL